MAPKKAAVTIAEARPSESSPAEESNKPDITSMRKLATHPSTAIMVREAIKALDSRKGVSSQAIQNYIKRTYPSVDLTRLKGLVRRALKKGLENGTLVRPANATATTGATGRFRLAKKESKAKSENVDPNVQKAPKAQKDGAKEDKPKKKKPADKKEEKEESSQEPKPAKKSKKDESSSKVAPVKKPKAAKKAAETEKEEQSETVKPKGKAKTVEDKGEKPLKAGKAQKEKGKVAQSKAQAKSDDPSAKAQGKRGKKVPE